MDTNFKFYAGIGSRQAPIAIQNEMTRLAKLLEEQGYTLRSGNATGADQAFARGVEKNAQIWLPSDSFEKEFQKEHPNHKYHIINESDVEAFKSVVTFHPKPFELSHFVCHLMARNYRQVVGRGYQPNSEFVIGWTPEGKDMGGSRQAFEVARAHDIPVINMFNFPTAEQVINHLTIWHGYESKAHL